MRASKKILILMIMFLLSLPILSVPRHVNTQPIASLTGVVYDGGVDTDEDGTFDYLEVGVEVDVVSAGTFIVAVEGLFDSEYNVVGVWNENWTYLDVGVQVVYVSLDGPVIYASGFNPISVLSIVLYDEFYSDLGNLEDVSLSRVYSFTEFGLPINYTLVFTVDPDGWITVDGVMNDTKAAISPFNFEALGDVRIMEEAATVDITLMIPEEDAMMLPFDSVSLSLLMDFEKGLLGTNLTVSLPSKQVLSQYISDDEILEVIEYFLNSTDFILNAEYLDGDANAMIQHSMEANLTDLIGTILDTMIGVEVPFTLDLNYSEGEYDGSVRLILLPGLPMEDLELDVTGNLTDLCFNGTIQVVYGDYSSIDPSLGMIDEATLDELEFYAENILNASIDVEGSLLNMSLGRVECSYIDIERQLVPTIGEVITFEVCIGEAMPGVFVFAPFYLLPSEVWEQGEQGVELLWMYFALNNTLYKIQDAEFQLVYTPADTKLDMTMDGTLHVIDLLEQLLEPIAVSEEWQGWGIPPELNSTILPLNWLTLEVLNSTLHSLESSSLHTAYHHDDRRAEMNFTSLVNMEGLLTMEGLLEDLTNLLLEISPMAYYELPPDYEEVLESILTARLANITVIQASLTYAEGEAHMLVDLSFEGDINAEINYWKSEVINLFSQTEPLTWQILYVNDTTIDATGVVCSFKMDDLSTEIEVEGVAIRPPLDPVNATVFKLDRFFNFTTFPRQGEQLEATVIGGSNTTHKVVLYNGTGVPRPDTVSVDADDRPTFMFWENVTLDDLRELQFILINLPPTEVTFNTPTQDETTETSVSLSWSENDDPDFVRYEIFQSTSPDDLGTSIANITVRETVSYKVTDLSPDTTYYFTVRVVDDVGLYSDSNQVTAKTKLQIWMQSWFIPSIIGVIAVAAVSLVLVRRRSIKQ